jgi:hypothetical protein
MYLLPTTTTTTSSSSLYAHLDTLPSARARECVCVRDVIGMLCTDSTYVAVSGHMHTHTHTHMNTHTHMPRR